MDILIASKPFSDLIDQNGIVEKTLASMKRCLMSWYTEDTETFLEDMRANLATVLDCYHFRVEFVSLTKNFNFAPPVDEISCTINITDADNDCCARYRAVFDEQFNIIDDVVTK